MEQLFYLSGNLDFPILLVHCCICICCIHCDRDVPLLLQKEDACRWPLLPSTVTHSLLHSFSSCLPFAPSLLLPSAVSHSFLSRIFLPPSHDHSTSPFLLFYFFLASPWYYTYTNWASLHLYFLILWWRRDDIDCNAIVFMRINMMIMLPGHLAGGEGRGQELNVVASIISKHFSLLLVIIMSRPAQCTLKFH